MEHNLRPPNVSEFLLEKEPESSDFGGETSDEELDNVYEMSDHKTDESSSEDNLESKIVNASEQHSSHSCSPERPVSVLRGTNGYTWSLNSTNRSSGKKIIIFAFLTLFTFPFKKLLRFFYSFSIHKRNSEN